jgi:hypothetical protein
MSSDIYNLLTGVKIEDTTVTQLDTAAGRTFVDVDNVPFWSKIITVARAIKESRTYAEGLPIPELGEMKSLTVGDGASGTIQPSGTEIWLLQGVNTDNCAAFLTDGSGMITLDLSLASGTTVTGPIYITNKVYIGFSNASGSEQTPSIAFQKVSL